MINTSRPNDKNIILFEVVKLCFIIALLTKNKQFSRRVSSTITFDLPQHAVSFEKGSRSFAGVRIYGHSVILQDLGSAVKLHIPEGLEGFVFGCIHTDVKPFLHAISEDECVVAPIPEYVCILKNGNRYNRKFRIQIPHCIDGNDKLTSVIVRHGDIHTEKSFVRAPTKTCSFEIDEKYITISTSSFSQFICTSCDWKCFGQGKAFIFGNILRYPAITPAASIRLYVTSPLYNIEDYEKV